MARGGERWPRMRCCASERFDHSRPEIGCVEVDNLATGQRIEGVELNGKLRAASNDRIDAVEAVPVSNSDRSIRSGGAGWLLRWSDPPRGHRLVKHCATSLTER